MITVELPPDEARALVHVITELGADVDQIATPVQMLLTLRALDRIESALFIADTVAS